MIGAGNDCDGTTLGFGAVPYSDASQRLTATPRFIYQPRPVLGRQRSPDHVKAPCRNHVKLLAAPGGSRKQRPDRPTDDNAASRTEA